MVGLVAAAAPSGGGGAGSLGTHIGEHWYWCWGKTPCEVPQTSFLGSELNIDTILLTIGVMVFIVLLALLVRSRLSLERPRGVQNVLEATFEFVNGFVTDTLGNERAKSVGPLAVALFLFLLLSNWLDVIPPIQKAPTSDLNTTLGLALMVFILIQVMGLRARGGGGYFKHFFEPYPFLFPINLIEELSKPVTLAFRLFGNILAGDVLILVFGTLLAGFLPALPIPHAFAVFLGLFVGVIQAFIFTVLTVSYIGIATSTEGH